MTVCVSEYLCFDTWCFKIDSCPQPHEMIDQITAFQKERTEIEMKAGQLSHLKLDAASIENIKRLKGNTLCFVLLHDLNNISKNFIFFETNLIILKLILSNLGKANKKQKVMFPRLAGNLF